MHPEILSISLFWFVTAYTPGPNNVVASYSGFNFGIKKTIPHILGVTLGFTSLVLFLDCTACKMEGRIMPPAFALTVK